jgi:hypothetical protein
LRTAFTFKARNKVSETETFRLRNHPDIQSDRIGVLLVNRPRPFANGGCDASRRSYLPSARPSRFANAAHWLRISGTATISQKAARVTGPIANSRSDGAPDRSTTAHSGVISIPMPKGSRRASPASRRLPTAGCDPQRHATDLPTIDNPVCFHRLDRQLATSSVADDRARRARLDRDQLGGSPTRSHH